MAKGSGGGGRSGRVNPEANVRAAMVGQPPIVQEALASGVSLLRVSLTKKEKAQLAKARRSGLLSYALNDPFRRTLAASPRTLYGR